MKLKFKQKHLSKAMLRRIRKRSAKYALALAVECGVTMKTRLSELVELREKLSKMRASDWEMMQNAYSSKLPRKAKKKLKQQLCNYYNRWVILPEVMSLILYQNEENSDQALHSLYRTWAHLPKSPKRPKAATKPKQEPPRPEIYY